MRLILAAFFAVLDCAAANPDGQSQIATDRPAVTASSAVVPAGSLQLESGLAVTSNQGLLVLDVPEVLTRFGLSSKTELRLTAPNFFVQREGQSGIGDLTAGIKRQLGHTSGGFEASVIFSLSLPAGSDAFSSHGWDPSVQAPWSWALSSEWTLAGMLSVYWPTQDGRRNTTGQPTLLIDRILSKQWDVFAEYSGDFPERGGPRHVAHFGTAFKPTSRQQLDLHVGVGLSSASVDHFVGVGYSYRFQVAQ